MMENSHIGFTLISFLPTLRWWKFRVGYWVFRFLLDSSQKSQKTVEDCGGMRGAAGDV